MLNRDSICRCSFLAAILLNLSSSPAWAACISPPGGLAGWWAGESNANDVLGFNPGTIQGNTVFQAGEVGQGFVFDGTNGYVQIPDAYGLSPHLGQAGELTLECWVLMPRLP